MCTQLTAECVLYPRRHSDYKLNIWQVSATSHNRLPAFDCTSPPRSLLSEIAGDCQKSHEIVPMRKSINWPLRFRVDFFVIFQCMALVIHGTATCAQCRMTWAIAILSLCATRLWPNGIVFRNVRRNTAPWVMNLKSKILLSVLIFCSF